MIRRWPLAVLLTIYVKLGSADSIVSFSPGPDFTTRVHTSWGDYIVDVSPTGGAAWVGTEAEYVNRKARAIMAREGLAEMHVDGQAPNEHTFVDTHLPLAQTGSSRLAQIQPSILFEEKPDFDPEACAPAPRAHTHYVGIDWVQNDDSVFHSTLVDGKTGRSFKPFHCWDRSNCLWQIPDDELGVPLTIVFTGNKRTPAAAGLRSIAFLDYQSEADTVRTTPALAADFLSRLTMLHDLDKSVPLTFQSASQP